MDKKELKFYEAPACEVVGLEAEGQLMAGSPSTNPLENNTAETEVME